MRSFRTYLALTGAVTLAACGGDTGPQTVGSNPPPVGGSTPTPTPANLLDVTSTVTYDTVGAFQALDTTTTQTTPKADPSQATLGVQSLYTANAATVNAPNGSITYSPRDGVFTVKIADSKAAVTRDYNFQDPAHRTQFSGSDFARFQIPDLATFNYLQVLDGNAQPVFFYQRPGAKTTFVSLAGFSRVVENRTTSSTATDDIVTTTFDGERGAFVFGQKTPNGQVPVSGEGSYNGDFLASMVMDPTGGGRSTLQWLTGTSAVKINFATGKADLALSGTVGEAYVLGTRVAAPIDAGSTFSAKGTAQVDLIRSGGFTGAFTQNTTGANNVGFTTGGIFTGIDFASAAAGGSTAGASSIDGAFFGPNAVNIGGNFRIVGGIPNQRVDILGAFSGAK
ncbi:hypothetical protein MZO42_02205 [Sphingomonas psychrotolerans]|uniref:Transferrin-binding protein B C-lobe/N-lobe beta barrel domain-containing protein n=1 Tax=Sphingomonas psychrotolerans TaxID=1327635 RepID=A0ABU3MYV4_9SPHN|nr:hypothetical protein [Sphingomonas psychrotolerans]MDT8757499.1 hypothetical protein [Sphingomonas psychrotolerans]